LTQGERDAVFAALEAALNGSSPEARKFLSRIMSDYREAAEVIDWSLKDINLQPEDTQKVLRAAAVVLMQA
jgi:hypothetical protein